MKYTIEDLRGKYVKTGTPEAEVFLDACEELGLKWIGGASAKEFKRSQEVIPIQECMSLGSNDAIGYSDFEWCERREIKPFTIKPEWSIYTNTLPLSELTDEQAGQLFHAWRKGAALQIFYANNGAWEDYHLSLCRCDVFRIKQKSERELFVDAMIGMWPLHDANAPTVRLLIEQFYDSGKFKLVKDGE